MRAGSTCQVEAELGAYEGVEEGGMRRFHAIAYAHAPVGPLRFAPPQPLEVGQGRLDCTSPAGFRACPDGFRESSLPRFLAYAAEIQGLGRWRSARLRRGFAASQPAPGEDCLRLSVYAPADPLASDGAAAGLPVVAWIDSGTPAYLPHWAFAAQDCVVVHVRHRTGMLGWFAHPALAEKAEDRGNQGLADVVQALRWVQGNVAAFGGDPGKVVLQGHGVGADLLLHLMACPQAHGLYAAAAAHSPTPVLEMYAAAHPWAGLPAAADAAEAFGRSVLDEMGVAASSADAGSGVGALDALRRAPAELLSAMCWGQSSPQRHVGSWGCPAAGAWGLPRGAALGFREGRQAKVPLLLGYAEGDGALSSEYCLTPLCQWHWGSALNHAVPVRLREDLGAGSAEILARYPMLDQGNRRAVQALRRDAVYAARTATFARMHARAGNRAYLYGMDQAEDPGRGRPFFGASLPEILGGALPWGGGPYMGKAPYIGNAPLAGPLSAFLLDPGSGEGGLGAWPAFQADAPARKRIVPGAPPSGWDAVAMPASALEPHALLEAGFEGRLDGFAALLRDGGTGV